MKTVEMAFQEFADGLHCAADENGFRSVGQRVAERLGFRYFAYLSLGGGGLKLISSYPKRWSDHYFAEGYDKVDPVVAFARRDHSLMRWAGETSAGAGQTRRQKRLFEDAGEFGIRYGVTVAITGGFDRSAAFTMAVDDHSPAHDELIERASDLMQLIGLTFHAHVDARHISHALDHNVPLTQRERECLSWAARGKSMEMTGTIMGISTRVVKFHLDNARFKLGAETLPHAVAMALRHQAIS